MTEQEYIQVLWRIITGESAVVVTLTVTLVGHIYRDGRVRERLRRLEDKLRINGGDTE